MRKMKSGGFVWEEKRERRNRFAEGNTTEKRQVHCSNAFGKYLQVILDLWDAQGIDRVRSYSAQI